MAINMQFAYRTQKGLGINEGFPSYEELKDFERPEGNLRCSLYSPCGKYFAWANTERVIIIDSANGQILSILPTENVYELGFSPKGTYIITWQRPSKDEAGDAVKNLKVWKLLDSQSDGISEDTLMVGKFVQKNQTGWNLQYTFDEKFCARVVTNEIQVYESHDLTKVWNKLRVEGVSDFAVSPGENHSIAVFVPERKGNPASVRVYNVPKFDAPASQKNFFKGDKVQLKWNDNGTSLIVLAQTEVDKTNKSYYGETTMYLLSANGGFDSRITLDKEGPIHDVSWSPTSSSFAVVYGYMPAKTVIFNAKAEAAHTFPLGPRNTVNFSSNGKFVLVAGFGNLAGQMDIYDLEKDYAKVCTIQTSNASVCEWSPDGSHILTATTSPRLRVDNGIRIWHASGQLMYNEEMNELYEVAWRPGQVPTKSDRLAAVPTPHASALKYLGSIKTPSKPAGAYRPPGARGQVTPLAFKREDEGGAAYVRDRLPSFSSGVNGFGKSRSRAVPGAESAEDKVPLPPGAAPGGGVSLTGTGEGRDGELLSKSAKKNAKKREAKKAAAAAAATTEDAPSTAPPALDAARSSPAIKSPNRSPDRKLHERSRSKGYIPAPAVPPGFENSKAQGRDRSRSQNKRAQADTGTSHPSSKLSSSHPNGAPLKPPITIQQRPQPTMTPASVQPSTITRLQPSSPSQPPSQTPTPKLTPTPTPNSPPELSSNHPHEKKIRGLLKKVRAIEELKMRLAGGEKLEDTQMKKIASEDGVRGELGGLGWSG